MHSFILNFEKPTQIPATVFRLLDVENTTKDVEDLLPKMAPLLPRTHRVYCFRYTIALTTSALHKFVVFSFHTVFVNLR